MVNIRMHSALAGQPGGDDRSNNWYIPCNLQSLKQHVCPASSRTQISRASDALNGCHACTGNKVGINSRESAAATSPAQPAVAAGHAPPPSWPARAGAPMRSAPEAAAPPAQVRFLACCLASLWAGARRRCQAGPGLTACGGSQGRRWTRKPGGELRHVGLAPAWGKHSVAVCLCPACTAVLA